MVPDQDFHRLLDQAESLRHKVLEATALVPATDQRGGLLVVVGTRPGVGASTVASQLAWQLYRKGHEVGLVQLDDSPRRGEFPAWEDRGRGARYPSWQEVAQGHRTLREAWRQQEEGLPYLGCHRGSDDRHGWAIETLPTALQRADAEVIGASGVGHSGVLGPWGARQLMLAAADRTVVVDAGRGAHLQCLLPLANHLCVVMNGDENQTTEHYACLKYLAAAMGGARCWLVVNRVTATVEANHVQQRLVATADRFLNLSLASAGCLPDVSGAESLSSKDRPDSRFEEGWGGTGWQEAMERIACRLEDSLVTRNSHRGPGRPAFAA